MLAALPALAAQPAPEGPPATVGAVTALTVVVDGGRGPGRGMVFPITVQASPGTGRRTANADIDDKMIRTLADVATWIESRRGLPGYAIPDGFPEAVDLRISFIPEARDGVVAGDSAGTALACAIYSAVSGTPVLNDVAMTGAIGPDGKVHAVAEIRAKLDGVLRQGLSTMILPAENWRRTEAEAREVWRAAAPRVRVVFVEDLDEVFFFAFGPYGPYAEEYATYSAALSDAWVLYGDRRYEDARCAFAEIGRRHPGDSTASVWRWEAEHQYAHDLLAAAEEALREGRLATANRLAFRALTLADAQSLPELPVLARALETGQVPPAQGDAPPALLPERSDGRVPCCRVARVPDSPASPRWAEARAVRLDLQGVRDAWAALAADDVEMALLVSYADPSGRVEDDPGRWYATAEGFAERGREDRAAVAWGGADVVSAAARRALAFEGTDAVDAWTFGAGPLRASGHALDLGMVAGPNAFDAGFPPLMRNEAAPGMPAGSFSGRLGPDHNPAVLRARDADYLTGDPVAGRGWYRARCAECHGAGVEGRAGLVPESAALEPSGTEEALLDLLVSDETHSGLVPPAAHADLIAHVRTAVAPPTWLVYTPEGSAADVKVSSRFRDGRWWVQFRRPLDTGETDDAALAEGRPIHLAVAVHDGASGRESCSDALAVEWR